MGLKMKVPTSKAFVTAVSGLFASKNNPNGLTPREIEFVCAAMDHSTGGVIVKTTRFKIADELKIDMRTYYNMAHRLKKKRAINDDQLHRVFTAREISVVYEK